VLFYLAFVAGIETGGALMGMKCIWNCCKIIK